MSPWHVLTIFLGAAAGAMLGWMLSQGIESVLNARRQIEAARLHELRQKENQEWVEKQVKEFFDARAVEVEARMQGRVN